MELKRKRTAYAIRVAMLEVHDPHGRQRAVHWRQRAQQQRARTAAAPQQESIHPPMPVMLGTTSGIDKRAPMAVTMGRMA